MDCRVISPCNGVKNHMRDNRLRMYGCTPVQTHYKPTENVSAYTESAENPWGDMHAWKNRTAGLFPLII